jgi:hypothetical protein
MSLPPDSSVIKKSFFPSLFTKSSRFVIGFALTVICSVATHAANIAPEGTGILGLNTGANTTLGSPFEHAGFASNVNDDNPFTSVDTFNLPGPTGNFSYVGVIFPALRSDRIVSLTLDLAAFFDGGWFGPNNTGPGASGTLNSSHLSEPTLQVTADGGNVWTTVGHTSNYLASVPGTVLPVAFGPPSHALATFTPNTPLTAINGVRLIGSEGGTASNGFLGVFELAIESNPIPEPSAFLIFFAGVAAFAGRRLSRG